MENIESKKYLLLFAKGAIQFLKILTSFMIPLLIAAYFYALVTALCDMVFIPDMSLDTTNLGVLVLSLFTVIPEIVAAIIGVVALGIYFVVKLVSKGIQSVLDMMLSGVERKLKDECIYESILDSKKVKYAVVCIAEVIAFVLLYSFFAKYDFNMNYFCYAIGGSSTFGTLIDLNEQFKMISFYLTALVLLGVSLMHIERNYINLSYDSRW